MRPEISLEEVKMIERLGVEFRYGVEIGKDLTIADLEKDYDAIFLGLGLGGANRLGIPGEDLPEVVDALDFIEWIHTKPLHEVPVGRRVAVLGCGNTAIDAVSQSKRLGAEVATIIYRRGENDMPAYEFEYELAKNDGATFHFHTIPTEVLGENGNVKALRLAKTEFRDGKLQLVPGSEWIEEFDLVLKAVGQEKQTSIFTQLFPGLKLDRKGRVEHNPETMETGVPKLFVGGDCANGGREVVNAVAEGKRAARGINAMLTKQKVEGPIQPSRHGAKNGATGSGFNNPIRVPELLAAMSK
jgi:glutamate synthase (NADPH/NADH) small chain